MKCKYCGREIPNFATKCKYCKAAIEPVVIEKPQKNKRRKNNGT